MHDCKVGSIEGFNTKDDFEGIFYSTKWTDDSGASYYYRSRIFQVAGESVLLNCYSLFKLLLPKIVKLLLPKLSKSFEPQTKKSRRKYKASRWRYKVSSQRCMDVILLQETMEETLLTLPGYKSHLTKDGRGICTIVKKGIPAWSTTTRVP